MGKEMQGGGCGEMMQGGECGERDAERRLWGKRCRECGEIDGGGGDCGERDEGRGLWGKG